MKKTVLTICMLLGVTAGTSYGGHMNGGMMKRQQQPPLGVMDSQQAPNMMRGRIRNQETMRGMKGLMKQMNETMQKMIDATEPGTGMEQRDVQAMGQMTR